MVAKKVALAARIDLYGSDQNGSRGEQYRREITENLNKSEYIRIVKQDKPLAIPEEFKSKKEVEEDKEIKNGKQGYFFSTLNKPIEFLSVLTLKRRNPSSITPL